MLLQVFIQTDGYGSKNKCYSYLDGIYPLLPAGTGYFFFDSIEKINDCPKQAPWYLVLQEGELVDRRLGEAICRLVSGMHGCTCVFNFFKRMEGNTRFTVSPRLFRSTVQLQPNSLMPVGELVLPAENILDGWIYEV